MHMLKNESLRRSSTISVEFDIYYYAFMPFLEMKSDCTTSKYKCCKDGVTAKIDMFGSNCPGNLRGNL